MRPTRLATCVALTLALFAATAQAAPLAPGALIHPLPGEAEPTGGVVVAAQTVPFVSATYSGTLTSSVIQGDTSNALGGLTFTYVLSNLAGGTHSLNRISINGFDGFNLDASFSAPPAAGTVAPAFVDREASGTAIGFSWASVPIGTGSVSPGTTSATMVVQTNSPVFVPTSAFVLDGFPAGMLSFAPVPEPSTLVLAAAGLALAAYGFCRRSQRGK